LQDEVASEGELSGGLSGGVCGVCGFLSLAVCFWVLGGVLFFAVRVVYVLIGVGGLGGVSMGLLFFCGGVSVMLWGVSPTHV